MKGRRPRRDELDLWKRVADRVTPIDPMRADARPKAAPPTEPSDKTESFGPLPTPRIGSGRASLKDDLAPSIEARIAGRPVQMDRKSFKQMQRGKLKPDGRIDLHGMTLDRAHAALTRFVMSSHGSGKRLLLVITGKGKDRDEGGPIPTRFGVLRHQVPEWLRLPPLNSVVLQVSQAHVRHGGAGAYYVYLRRAR